MFQNERFDRIYTILSERGSVTVQYLQKQLFVSEATVRRDLEIMENNGLLRRVWGGAMLPSTVKDIPSFVREKSNLDKKEAIAAIASRFLKNSCTVFFDSSTTCLSLVPYFSELKNMTVITNSLKMSYKLGEHGNTTVHVLGGQVYEGYVLSGYLAVDSVQKFHTELMFFSCSGISSSAEITSVEPKVVEVVQKMLHNSEKRILLCDTSKVGKNALLRVADLTEPDYVIMDGLPTADPKLIDLLGDRLITPADRP